MREILVTVWRYARDPLFRELVMLCRVGVGEPADYEHGVDVEFVVMRDKDKPGARVLRAP